MSDEFMQIGLPPNITVANEFGHLRIVRKWFSYKYIFLTVFAIFWCGFLLFWYGSILSFPRIEVPAVIAALLFPLLHVAVGIGLAYYTLAGYLNKTVIEVGFDSLTIKHGPLLTWGNRKISPRELKQLYVKEDGYSRGGQVTSYAVHAIMSDQKNIKLLEGLDTSEQALFIEQEIEKFVRIEDRPVKGEIR
jgi:hypothetical protein